MPLNVELIRKGIDKAFDELSYIGGHDAMEAIMTTDTVPKLYEKETVIGGKPSELAVWQRQRDDSSQHGHYDIHYYY